MRENGHTLKNRAGDIVDISGSPPLILRYIDGTAEVLSGWLVPDDPYLPEMQYRARIGANWMRAEMRIRVAGREPGAWETMRYIGPGDSGEECPTPGRFRRLEAVYHANQSRSEDYAGSGK